MPELGDAVPRHPVPLYEVAGASTIGLVLLWLRPPRAEQRGRTFGWFLISYAVLRFALEFLRGDPRGPVMAGFSVSQWFSLAGASIGLVLLLKKR